MKSSPVKVALVNSHQLYRKGLAAILSSNNDIQVISEASSSKEYFIKTEKNAIPDVVITNISLPQEDGYSFCKQLKKRQNSIKILATGIYYDEKAIIRMLTNGANGYITKDTSEKDLAHAILQVHQQGYYYPSSLSEVIFKALHEYHKEEWVFTKEENQFLQYCCTEMSYKEIAKKMRKQQRSIEWLRDNMFKRLMVHTRVGLVMYAIKTGLVYLE